MESDCYYGFKDSLNGRLQQVVLNGSASKIFTVSSGVPQGSDLGPLLFLVYVNDIPEHVECNISMFTDDTKIYASVVERLWLTLPASVI